MGGRGDKVVTIGGRSVGPVGSELSTLSTPPTVGSPVETSGEATASSSGLGSQTREEGESEREKPDRAADTAWARALRSAEACRRGVCAYKNPEAPRDGRAAGLGCDGYQASRGLEPDGRPVVRWNLCPRHRVWWAAEQRRRRARRQREANPRAAREGAEP
jgi:hypothetical protein